MQKKDMFQKQKRKLTKFVRYKWAPVLLLVAGVIFAVIGYAADLLLNSIIILWSVLAVVSAGIGFMAGQLLIRLETVSYIDPLTMLLNRRCFYKALKYEVDNSRNKKSSVCVAMVDVDNFKRVNDTYGHFAGDNVLIYLAEVFVNNTRDTDSVCRLGGDEFSIIFPDMSLENAVSVCERIRVKVEQAEKLLCRATVSIGIVSDDRTGNYNRLLTLADQVMYEAKKIKNKVVVLDG